MKPAAFVAVVLLVAAGARALSADGFWMDEVFSAANARAGPGSFLERRMAEPHSPWPVYYFLLGAFMRVVPGVAGMRLLSGLLSLATIPLVARLAGRLGGSPAARTAAVLAAANPLLAWYGAEIRMYALQVLLATGALVAGVAAVDSRRAAPAAWFGALAGVSLFAHVFSAFALLPVGIAILWRGPGRTRLAAVAAALPFAAVAAALLPAVAVHWLSWKAGTSGGFEASPLALLAAGQAFFTAYSVPLSGWSLPRLAAVGAALVLATPPLIAAARRRQAATVVLLFTVVAAVALPWALMLRSRMFSPRFALLAVPPLLALLAGGLAPAGRGLRVSVAGGILLLSGLAIGFRAGRTDWREVAALLAEHRGPDEPVLFEGGNRTALVEWFGIPILEEEPGSPAEYARRVPDRPGYWFILFRPPGPSEEPPPGYAREEHAFGPERRIVEDEAPRVVRFVKR